MASSESEIQPETPNLSPKTGKNSDVETHRQTSAGFESSSVLIVPEKLTGENYLEWSQSMKLALQGRDKLGHITCETPDSPSSNHKAFKQVDKEQ